MWILKDVRPTPSHDLHLYNNDERMYEMKNEEMIRNEEFYERKTNGDEGKA